MMAQATEAFSRAVIDTQLKDVGWKVIDGISVRFEHTLPDGTRADYLLCDRNGRGLAVIEAKKSSINAGDAAEQARHYAEQLDVPFIFLANGKEIKFWDWRLEAYPHPVSTFFSQNDLERRAASRIMRCDPLNVPIDKRIVERDYQVECIDALCKEIKQGRRKLLVEMATGTGKTRTAAAFIDRLFKASAITRVLFLVDRIPLALQTEDAFNEYLRDYPCYVLRSGRRFDDAKRVTITTLQSMINIYHEYSSGYFDLIISDECHRSIYGKWKKVLLHFDGIQVGLTATPCIADENKTGDEEDGEFVKDTLRFFEVQKPTFHYNLKQAIDDGYLVPYQIYKAKTVKTAADGGFKVEKSEIQWDGLDARTTRELEDAFQKQNPILVDPNALERRFTIPERNRAIVREYRKVMDEGYWDAATSHIRTPLYGKTIVFAVTKAHAATLAEMFDQEFAHLKPSPEVRYADYVVSGTGADDTVDGIAKIKRFKKEKFPQILVSVNMLDTGFDCPEVMNLVFARFTRSVILYRQMRGRGTRKAHGKPMFTMFDFVGVTDYHQDDDTYASGGKLGQTKPGYKPNPITVVTVDTDDHIDPATRGWITYDEQGNIVFAEPSEAKANELGLRFEEWLSEQDDLTHDQERWLHQVENQIRRNADIWDEFTIDHLELDALAHQGGKRKGVQLFGSENLLARMIQKLSRAVFGERGARH
jgi:type I restriction enzyme R subunit